MAIDKATVAKVAALARMRVPEAELDALTGELGQIISWVEQLAEVDTTGVEPMTSVVAVDLPRRPDAVTDGGYCEKVLANAPQGMAGFFAVPKVIE
ncbi:MAG: Asp-tRNA(Asn)/Glu-tRNA(Gln) amidotransferase subunit GatC [Alphaproteobacteria bacterium]|nr:Asp-tRNA(Asn)/Glu-tRNA(Gln) amidotransferase subunit GatC [Alphaproteobacteria bacterium]